MSDIDKVVLSDIKDILADWRAQIEENILKSKNFKLVGHAIEISGNKGDDPIEFFLTDMLPDKSNRRKRKECLKAIMEWAALEMDEIDESDM